MSRKISLKSRYLKVGDKIIRTIGEHSNYCLEVMEKSSTHIKLKSKFEICHILSIETWDSSWVRYPFKD